MARQQTPAQRETVERVMHEFKHGELKTVRGNSKVKNPKQAVAIALHEAGASKFESPKENRRNLRRTKAKESRGETYKDEAEGWVSHQLPHRQIARRQDQGRTLCRGEAAQRSRPLDNEQAPARTRARPLSGRSVIAGSGATTQSRRMKRRRHALLRFARNDG